MTLAGSESLKELSPTQYATSCPNSLSIHARKRLTRGKLECALGNTRWCAATAALRDSGATSTSVPAARLMLDTGPSRLSSKMIAVAVPVVRALAEGLLATALMDRRAAA